LKRIDTDNSLEDVVERTEGKKHSLFSAGFIKKDKVCLTITGGKKTILYDYPRYMSDTEVIIIALRMTRNSMKLITLYTIYLQI
jgi:hypothetical protein